MANKYDDLDFDYGIDKCNEALRNGCILADYPLTPSIIRDIREILGMLCSHEKISSEDAIRYKDFLPVQLMLTDHYWLLIRDYLDSLIH